MAFTTVPSVTTSEEWSAADHNTYVKNNFAASPPGIFAAAGDLFVGEGADTGGILSKGTSGYFAIVDSAETLGIKWVASTALDSAVFAWTGDVYVNADYDGDDTFGAGTITINLAASSGYNIPAGTKLLQALLSVNFNSVSATASFVYITSSNYDSGEQMVRVDYISAGIWIDKTGLVYPSGDAIQVVVPTGADILLDLSFSGYF